MCDDGHMMGHMVGVIFTPTPLQVVDTVSTRLLDELSVRVTHV